MQKDIQQLLYMFFRFVVLALLVLFYCIGFLSLSVFSVLVTANLYPLKSDILPIVLLCIFTSNIFMSLVSSQSVCEIVIDLIIIQKMLSLKELKVSKWLNSIIFTHIITSSFSLPHNSGVQRLRTSPCEREILIYMYIVGTSSLSDNHC